MGNIDERLEAITVIRTKEAEVCNCCGVAFENTDMWHCYRYGKESHHVDYYYCMKCMPTPEAVLHEIDTDDVPFGLSGIDEYGTGFKKDFTRLNAEAAKKKDKKKK